MCKQQEAQCGFQKIFISYFFVCRTLHCFYVCFNDDEEKILLTTRQKKREERERGKSKSSFVCYSNKLVLFAIQMNDFHIKTFCIFTSSIREKKNYFLSFLAHYTSLLNFTLFFFYFFLFFRLGCVFKLTHFFNFFLTHKHNQFIFIHFTLSSHYFCSN